MAPLFDRVSGHERREPARARRRHRADGIARASGRGRPSPPSRPRPSPRRNRTRRSDRRRRTPAGVRQTAARVMYSRIAVPLSRPSGLISRMPFPGCRRHPDSDANAAVMWRAQGAMNVRRESAAPAGSATPASRPCPRGSSPSCRAANARARGAAARARTATGRCRCSEPSAPRRSSPCWPAIGSASPRNRRSASASVRPVISATAPSSRRASAGSNAAMPASTRTRSGRRRELEQGAVDVEEERAIGAGARAADLGATTARAPPRPRGAIVTRCLVLSHGRTRPRPRGSARAGASPRRRAACAPPSGRR